MTSGIVCLWIYHLVVTAENATRIAAKLGAVVANLATLASFAVSIVQRPGPSQALSGFSNLNIVIHLSLLTAILYGILWSLSERVFGWAFGAGGGESLPSGWSAAMLGVSMTLPLAVIPPLYAATTKLPVVPVQHWRVMILVVLLGVAANLFMYGTNSNGIRQHFAPTGEYKSFRLALTLEAIYSAVYFIAIVLPYRLVVEMNSSIVSVLLSRVCLPAITFFFGMAVFTALKWPESLHEKTWIQVRGVISGLIMMFCFCGAMFL